ncbi:hypothetical protein BY458DRAFT_519480 [Sporodiniella umbellata]|nr:hypothetical protein BY458DRAFT_519480 [Sporodiniella umbellata]
MRLPFNGFFFVLSQMVAYNTQAFLLDTLAIPQYLLKGPSLPAMSIRSFPCSSTFLLTPALTLVQNISFGFRNGE